MQPTNKSERKKAFLNFLLLFLVSVIVIIATIFASREVPFKDNDQLRSEGAVASKERDFANSFFTQMSDIGTALDTINTKVEKPEILDATLEEKIKKLNVMLEADSSGNKKFYTNIVFMLDNLRLARKDSRTYVGKVQDMTALLAKNKELTDRLDTTITANRGLRDYIARLPVR